MVREKLLQNLRVSAFVQTMRRTRSEQGNVEKTSDAPFGSVSEIMRSTPFSRFCELSARTSHPPPAARVRVPTSSPHAWFDERERQARQRNCPDNAAQRSRVFGRVKAICSSGLQIGAARH